MEYFIFILLICFLAFLFCLHFLSRDDLSLLRKDISLEKIFNTSFTTFFAGLFFARLFYAIFNSIDMLMKPLVFFLFPYFPGLSLTGGVLGGTLFLIYYLKVKKMPMERIFDFFSISTLAAFPIGYLGYLLILLPKGFSLEIMILTLIYTMLFFIFIKFLCFGLLFKGKLKDGTIGLIFIFSFSLISLFTNIVTQFKNFKFVDQPQNYILLGALLVSLVLFMDKEDLLAKFSKIKR
ncbi:MAG: prolipoprotein diacylglyceryl transferase [Candidatus Levybacteria bacterium]|nr:prolipoprotein diacylglyceryl transferase [Candidatus Levybacteria bacterium]